MKTIKKKVTKIKKIAESNLGKRIKFVGLDNEHHYAIIVGHDQHNIILGRKTKCLGFWSKTVLGLDDIILLDGYNYFYYTDFFNI